MRKIFLLTLLVLLSNSCSGQAENQGYIKFGKQITSNGKYVIYDYARKGSMLFSSDISGLELFKIDQTFSEGKGIKINGQISEWISNDTLLIYNFKSDLKQPEDTLPIKIEYSNAGDFIIKTMFYKPNAFYRSIVDFDSVEITSDSIFIHQITSKNERKILRFPLGGTTIKTKNDSITHIEITSRLNKSMNFRLKNRDGTFTTGLPEIGTRWYDIRPVKKISPEGMSKRKVFWDEQ